MDNRILQGAQELFFRYGIKSVTMDDIAKQLGMSKKTIYQYYADKDKIVNDLIRLNMESNEHDFEQMSKTSKDPVHEILELMKHMQITFTKINPNLFYDMMKYHPEAHKKFKDFKDKCMHNYIEMNLKKGMEMGLYRNTINIKIMATARLVMVEMAMNPTIFPPDKFNHVEVQMQLLDGFLHGICTLKGYKLVNKYKNIVEQE